MAERKRERNSKSRIADGDRLRRWCASRIVLEFEFLSRKMLATQSMEVWR